MIRRNGISLTKLNDFLIERLNDVATVQRNCFSETLRLLTVGPTSG